MRIDGVSRETEPHLFVYINRCYSHFLVIPSMILTGNDHDQMTTDRINSISISFYHPHNISNIQICVFSKDFSI